MAGIVSGWVRRRSARAFRVAGALLASVLILGESRPANAQDVEGSESGTITGVVTDMADGPVAGARVRLNGAESETETDFQGRFRITGVAPGARGVIVTADGFRQESVESTVPAGGSAQIVVRLTPEVFALDELLVDATRLPGTARTAPEVDETLILAGTKNEIIEIAGLAANLSEKTARQVFARVPGIFVYDMDGSGNQVNISTRGLDAHRSWEMNVRQDGVLLNSDLYGYPASHYSPPMEGIEEVEVIRGTAALQYGPQFGGMVNYVTKEPRSDRLVEVESINTAGSFGLLSTYAGVGGETGPVTYYAYVNERVSDGYRQGSRSEASAQYLRATVELSPTLRLQGQVGHSTYVYKLPGPLTDSMFRDDPRQASRTRNFYNPDITVPALGLDWEGPNGTRLTAQVSAILGPRKSVQFVGFANEPDLPDPVTQEYAPRQVDIDRYQSFTGEVRLVRPWEMGGNEHVLAVGSTLSHNDMHRRQRGVGTTGSDFDVTVTPAGFGRDVHYKTVNGALYLENIFRVNPDWSLVPGMRFELGRTRLVGRLAYYDPEDTPRQIDHRYPLFGMRTSYRPYDGVELYGGWSQAYRPQIMMDVLPGSELERTDRDLDDSRGWTLEGGVRGGFGGRFVYDASLFELRVNDRFGTMLRTDPDGDAYLFRTNIGSSRTRGLEMSLEALLFQRAGLAFRANTATSYYDGRYLDGTVVSGGQNVDITGNRIESVPRWISRNGFLVDGQNFSASLLLSYVSNSFADPLNTVEPSPTGAVGLVPAYTLLDVNVTVRPSEWLRLRAGINNLFDEQYFTKRPEFYPGPGIWPSDGRKLQLSLELQR